MNANDFCFWLKGWTEIQNPATIDEKQLQEIRNHLDLVITENQRFDGFLTSDEIDLTSPVVFDCSQLTKFAAGDSSINIC